MYALRRPRNELDKRSGLWNERDGPFYLPFVLVVAARTITVFSSSFLHDVLRNKANLYRLDCPRTQMIDQIEGTSADTSAHPVGRLRFLFPQLVCTPPQ